mmetsp:Transcript_40742/g.73606  ORF Transcript_40742/g.73606 Transcript_40742/m.73606 type:complete len:302 (-) Transcript_40742:95-1000(-)
MYIGPWQEYKLARLLQKQAQDEDSRKLTTRHLQLPRQRSVDRAISSRSDLKAEDLETASVTSSTRSSTSFISTRSAPSRVGSQSSAQARLDRLYNEAERGDSCGAVHGTGKGGRPASAASSRPGGRPPLAGRPPPAKRPCAKKTAKQSEQSLLDQRRARISQMQKLYGLGGSEHDSEAPNPAQQAGDVHASMDGQACGGGVSREPEVSGSPVAVTSLPPWQKVPDGVRVSLDATNRVPSAADLSRLETVPEYSQKIVADKVDPLALSISGGMDDNLIAWSQNLRPEDLSPEATLESFFPML